MNVTLGASLITTTAGTVRGAIVDGIHRFRGIPYAAPPFGPRRLRPPEPVEPWTGVRDAIEEGAIPPQPQVSGSPAEAFLPPAGRLGDDCLNLDIWTPAVGPARLPVFVWITGGAFQFGSAAWYDGSRFARDGVVCVSLNYRTGAEGFALPSDGVANRGLLDQVAALEWVRDSIAAFGGDPANVTVCGESAGAMSIGVLLAMPRARGLFRRAILESGASQHVLPEAEGRTMTALLAERMGVAPTVDGLAALPADRMVAAYAELQADVMAHPDPGRWSLGVIASSMPMQPVVDGDVVPAPPLEAIRAGSAADVDVIVGSNTDDWRLFTVASGAIGTTTDAALAGAVADYGSQSVAAYGLRAEQALPAYRSLYPGATPGDLLAAVQTDWWCRIPAIRLADAHAGGRARTYQYEFGWRSPVMNGLFGSCHALEIPFVFDTIDQGAGQMLGNLLGDQPPQRLATTMHAAWVSFARTGDPAWPAYEPVRRATMRFGDVSGVVEDPRSAERALWEGIR